MLFSFFSIIGNYKRLNIVLCVYSQSLLLFCFIHSTVCLHFGSCHSNRLLSRLQAFLTPQARPSARAHRVCFHLWTPVPLTALLPGERPPAVRGALLGERWEGAAWRLHTLCAPLPSTHIKPRKKHSKLCCCEWKPVIKKLNYWTVSTRQRTSQVYNWPLSEYCLKSQCLGLLFFISLSFLE